MNYLSRVGTSRNLFGPRKGQMSLLPRKPNKNPISDGKGNQKSSHGFSTDSANGKKGTSPTVEGNGYTPDDDWRNSIEWRMFVSGRVVI